MIDPRTVQQILDAARVEDVIRSYGVELHKAGSVLKGLCPFHEEKTPSFVVSPAKGIFKCFGCGKSGHAVSFVMEKEQCSYPQALKILAKRYNIEVPERELTDEEKAEQSERQNMFALNEWFVKYLQEIMFSNEEGRAVGLSYFRNRQFTDETIRKFQLGYSLPENDAATQAALKAGFTEKILIDSGITGKNDQGKLYDRFRGRVMFPIANLTGKIVAFGGRILEKKENVGKYVNTPENIVYHKSDELYGFFQAKNDIHRCNSCILVEGYADVISMHQAGVRNVVASCGTSLTEEQVKAINRFTNNILIIYDGDNAGIKASIRAIDMVLAAKMNVQLLLLPGVADPDDFAKSHQLDEIEEYLKNNKLNFIQYKIRALLNDRFDDPIAVQNALNSVLESIAKIPDAMTQELYLKETSKLFDIDKKLLLPSLSQMVNEDVARVQAMKDRRQYSQQGYPQQGGMMQSGVASRVPFNQPKEESGYPFDLRECEIVQFIVRHCTETVHYRDESDTKTPFLQLPSYRITDLLLANMEDLVADDGTTFKNPKYQKFINCIQQGPITDDKYFLFNEDPEISAIAASLILDKDVISKRFMDDDDVFKMKPEDLGYEKKKAEFELRQQEKHETKLVHDIVILINEYKRDILVAKHAEVLKKIQEDPNNAMELLPEVQRLAEMIQKF